MRLSPNEHRVLMAWSSGCVDPLNEEWVYSFKTIGEHAQNVPQHGIRRTVRALARKGLLKLATGFDEDRGLIAGRGYMLTYEGIMELRRRLEVTKGLTSSSTGRTEPPNEEAKTT